MEGVGISTDESFEEYFDRLEEGTFKFWTAFERAENPAGYEHERGFFRKFKALCKFREREGRDKFGLDYLQHDFWKNMSEEAADILVYAYLRALRTRRETGEDDDIEILLQGSKQVIEGLETLMSYRPKRLGSP